MAYDPAKPPTHYDLGETVWVTWSVTDEGAPIYAPARIIHFFGPPENGHVMLNIDDPSGGVTSYDAHLNTTPETPVVNAWIWRPAPVE